MMVPWTTVPFLSSMVTVSLFSFIRNLRKRNPRPNPHRFVRDCTKQIREVKRIEGKENQQRMLAYLTSFFLEALGGGRRGGGKARVFAGELLPRADSERGRRHKTPYRSAVRVRNGLQWAVFGPMMGFHGLQQPISGRLRIGPSITSGRSGWPGTDDRLLNNSLI